MARGRQIPFIFALVKFAVLLQTISLQHSVVYFGLGVAECNEWDTSWTASESRFVSRQEQMFFYFYRYTVHSDICRVHSPTNTLLLTFWHQNYFFLILAHTVYKM